MQHARTCRGCGGEHGAEELFCPKTRRSPDDGPVGTLVGPYEVGRLLGAGGCGAVYQARDSRTGVAVALKLLHTDLVGDPSALQRFIQEAEVTLKAGNPHIVRVLDTSFVGTTVYVALELLVGDTLERVMRKGPLPAARAVDIAIQMLDGLAVAHAAGVIHRDIKPANIFLADEPGHPQSLVKILDFGVGRMLEVDASQRLTRTGMQLGTPHIMAPEQVFDSKRTDARADLYSVAATLYSMLTNERPYGRIGSHEWIIALADRKPPPRVSSPVERLPEGLIDAIAVGLAINPNERFQDAGAFARAILDAVPDSPARTRALPALFASLSFTMSQRGKLTEATVAAKVPHSPVQEAAPAPVPMPPAPAPPPVPYPMQPQAAHEAPLPHAVDDSKPPFSMLLLASVTGGVLVLLLLALAGGALWLASSDEPSVSTTPPSVSPPPTTVTQPDNSTGTLGSNGIADDSPLRNAQGTESGLGGGPQTGIQNTGSGRPVVIGGSGRPVVMGSEPVIQAPPTASASVLSCLIQGSAYRTCVEYRPSVQQCSPNATLVASCPTAGLSVNCVNDYGTMRVNFRYYQLDAASEEVIRRSCVEGGGRAAP